MTAKPNPSRILFSLSGSSGTHYQMFEPIVRHLRHKHEDIICDVVSSEDFFGRTTDRDNLASTFDDVTVIHDHCSSIPVRAVRWLADRCPPLKPTARRLESDSVARAMQSILNANLPSVLVAANDRAFPELDIVTTSRAAGIPAVLVQESIRKDEIFKTSDGSRMNGQGGCDVVAAWGPSSRDYYLRVGVDERRITMSGNPRIDTFVEQCSGLSQSELRERYGVPTDRHILLFATNPVYLDSFATLTKDQYLQSLRAVLQEASAPDNNAFVIFKPHPLEIEQHARWGLPSEISDLPYASYAENMPLAEAVALCDSVLIFNSTVAVEAAFMQKGSGILNLFGVNMGVDFAKTGLSTEIVSEDELKAFVNGTTAAAPSPDIAAHVVSNVGRAAEAISELIMATKECGQT